MGVVPFGNPAGNPIRYEERGKIGGPGIIVQIDEAQIGRHKYNRGRVPDEVWVFGMIASDGRLRLQTVEDRKKDTLHEVILASVERGSIIHTDQWRAYGGLDALGYIDETVNHSVEFVSEDGVGRHTQAIESQWRAIRRGFTLGGVPHTRIGPHLAEYMWRRDCLRTNKDPFLELVRLLRCY